MENNLLSALMQSREAYDTLASVISTEDFSDKGNLICKAIQEYYLLDPNAGKVDKEVLLEKLEKSYPQHIKLLSAAINNLDDRPSIPNIMEAYKSLKLRAVSSELIGKLAEGRNHNETLDLMEDYRKLLNGKAGGTLGENQYNIYIGEAVDSVMEIQQKENLVPMAPGQLNEHLEGGVPRGTHIVLYARPEVGKSLFAINLASTFLKAGKKVLYINNEDPAKKVLARFLTRLALMDKYQIMNNGTKAYDKAIDNGYELLTFADIASASIIDVYKLAELHDPEIIIVDQMRNVTPKKELSRVESLEAVAQGLRELYKEHDAVGLSITQAGDSAENKAVLGLGDVDFSNTGIPATADLMIGLGATEHMKTVNQVCVNLPKNKVSSIHEQFMVVLDPTYSTVVDV